MGVWGCVCVWGGVSVSAGTKLEKTASSISSADMPCVGGVCVACVFSVSASLLKGVSPGSAGCRDRRRRHIPCIKPRPSVPPPTLRARRWLKSMRSSGCDTLVALWAAAAAASRLCLSAVSVVNAPRHSSSHSCGGGKGGRSSVGVYVSYSCRRCAAGTQQLQLVCSNAKQPDLKPSLLTCPAHKPRQPPPPP